MRFLLSLSALLLVAMMSAPDASAQTRLSVLGGGLVPFGDLDDTSDPSIAFGLQAEFQPVNALGQRRLLAFQMSGVYSSLNLDDAYETIVSQAGGDTSASLLELNVGVKAYSQVAPFFVSGGAGYSRLSPAGSGSDLNGVNLAAGLGFLLPLPAAVLQVEGQLHQVFAEDEVDFQYLTVMFGVGLPF